MRALVRPHYFFIWGEMMDDFIYLKPANNIVGYRAMSNDIVKNKQKLILVKHGHIAITDYKLGDNWEFEKLLSVWIKTHFKYSMIGGYYVKYLRELRIPRGFDMHLLKRHFPDREFKLYQTTTKHESIKIDLKTAPRTDIQVVAISHMICAKPYEHLYKYTQQLITMDTGEGKSYSTIASIAFHAARAIIIAPTVRIADQWKEYFIQYTDIPEKKVVVVSGKASCDRILNNENNEWIYIFINKTLSDYLTRRGPYNTEKMLANTKAKIKVVDEVHRNMKSIVALDALSNFKMNYYLTASAGRADKVEDRIFSRCFKLVPMCNGIKTKEEAHINVIIKKYHFPVPHQIRSEIVVPRVGMNSNLYENALFSYAKDQLLNEFDFIMKWISKHNPSNNKILILTATINGIEQMQKHIQKKYPDKKVTTYHSNLSKVEKESFTDGDIIIATDKGSGYGVDIPGVQFMINILTYSNKQGAIQFKGRLRKMEEEVYYFELVNWAFDKTYQQYMSRKPHLKSNAKKGIIIELD